MTGWIRGTIAAYDCESTSANPTEARIVTAALITLTPGQAPVRRSWVVNPGVEVPEEAAKIHGYDTARCVAEGMDAAQAVAEIHQEIGEHFLAGHPVVIYNSPYDCTVLAHELARHGLPALGSLWPIRPIVDPFVIDRHTDKFRKGKRTLTAVCEHYNVKLDGAHDSAADALAAARVAWRLATETEHKCCIPQESSYDPPVGCDHGPIGQMRIDDLHDLEVVWHKEWADGFREYLERQGQDASDVDGSWPVRSVAA